MNEANAQRDRKALEIFGRVLELPGNEARAAYIEGACGGDDALKGRVMALLANHVDDGFLQKPAAALGLGAKTATVLVTEKPGDCIGRYKLLQQIGEGGCGVVYMAEQEEPVRRRVALKVIKLGMDTKQVIARFEAERQALALMDHPNIAKVLDAGATETGRPYFVMELVRGVKITEFCDQNKLSTAERLKLFIPVCQAIQHAHQKGIIHRDLKPSNVMVTLSDGEPHPMVIDFGVAKATNQKLTEKTLFTNFGQMIGTLAYMAPEQASISRLDVDARSDVYSLGVLLYELLTGSQPFPEQELRDVGWAEMQRIITEQEPPTPSRRLSSLTAEQRTNLAKRYQENPAHISGSLRGDLDWIVMKCLEKDRRRRYDTATGLALDIERHLTDRPVAARSPSPLYQLRKFIVRNRISVGATCIALVAATSALVVGIRVGPGFKALPGVHAVSPGVPGHSQPAELSPAPLHAVSGVVLADDTGQPLTGALVRIAAPSVDMRTVRVGKHKLYEGFTDANGRFDIQVPQAADFALDAFLPAYGSAAGTFALGRDSLRRRALENLSFESNSLAQLVVRLPATLYVAGVVVDETGRQLPDVEVEASWVWGTGPYGSDGYANIADARTDGGGKFAIFDFPLQDSDDVPRGQLMLQRPDKVRSIIPDVYSLSQEERKNLRITLHSGHAVRGNVLSFAGRPAANTTVELIPSDPHAQRKVVVTDTDGNFVMSGVPAGEAVLKVRSLALQQKGQTTVNLKGGDIEASLKLQPWKLQEPPQIVSVLGMRLVDLTPELKAVYDLGGSTGVLVMDPGENRERLGIGDLREGHRIWTVGNQRVGDIRKMVTELLRVNDVEPPARRGEAAEGYRGHVRVVYSDTHRSYTHYLTLTDDDVEQLNQFVAKMAGDKGTN